MRFGGFTLCRWHAQLFVIVPLLVWAAASYVRSLYSTEPRPSLHGAGLLVVVLNVATVAALSAGLWLTRKEAGQPRWRAESLLLTAMATSLWQYAISPDGGAPYVFAMIALWSLLHRFNLALGIASTAATALTIGLLGALFRTDGAELGLMAAFVGVAFGALGGRQSKEAREATQRAEAANAVLAERSRIAREIHDILAHSLSAQVVHLEGARMLLSREGDRVQALDRVERAQRLARAGLEETRRALATLRGDAPAPEEALAELAEEFYASTGRACEIEVTGEPRELSPQAGLAVTRTAQEALTNVRKHAPGARVHAALRYLEGVVELDVADSGGTEPVLEVLGGGYGLVGMRERAELIGGTLETGPEDKGFRVLLRVPL
ncbi:MULTISPECIES: sensor histidine kinase [Thermomonosporaceae]|uniref:sensor histidine kinase n=1 Tax=Thermomonosporaceae TaxID=2012 RepID=UPI00255AE1BC|nr:MULTISPECIES: histidine kinase [Thermomonosporaceae]MDL4775125.1 histidine kinase [Actinomadura xylanilytica]